MTQVPMKHILLGAAYYPEHDPEDEWALDAKLMQELGFNVIRVGERLNTALMMMQRFLHERGGTKMVEPAVLRKSLAETYCNLGFALRPFQRSQSIRWFLKAIGEAPTLRPAWRGLLGAFIPRSVRSFLRGGKNWDDPYYCAENDPKKRRA